MKKVFCLNHAISVIFIFSLFQFPSLKAQVACSQNLATARNLFSAGRFYDIENTLEGCLKDGFTKQEKVDALRLLSLSYLYLDKYKDADSAYLLLLKTSPEFRADSSADPPDLVFLDRSFRHKPIFRWSVFGGVNQVFPRVIYNYNTRANTTTSRDPLTGYNFGAGLEIDLYKNISINVDGQYRFSQYTKISHSDSLSNISDIINFRMNWLNFPVYLKYKIGNKRLKPFIAAGGSFDLLLNAIYPGPKRTGGGEVESAEIKLNQNINPVNYSVYLQTGIIYKSKNISSFALNVTYGFGLTNIANIHNRYDFTNVQYQQPLILFPAAVLSDQRLDHISVSVRFIQPVYKPTKLKVR